MGIEICEFYSITDRNFQFFYSTEGFLEVIQLFF